MESEKCKLCTFDFKPGTLVDGKCLQCTKKYGDVSSIKEWKEGQDPQAKEENKATEERIGKIVDRKLKEIGILSDCDCGKSFFKRSPSHKSCGNCPKETN